MNKIFGKFAKEYSNIKGIHNPHGPAKSSNVGYVYCQNGRMQNIVGIVNKLGKYYINNKNIEVNYVV